MMIIEQAKMIIEMGEASMASDIQMMLDTYAPYVDEAYTMCLEYTVAAPPVEEVTDAPAEATAESESSPETATPVDDATEEVAPAVDEEEPPAAE
jgi:hypothetical protein